MQSRRITIIQGHPDPAGNRFDHALAGAYAEGAKAAGHAVDVIDVARLDFPFLRTQEEWNSAPAPQSLRPAQTAIAGAEHVVIVFPLWLGTMPALLKAFLEQVFRPGFAIEKAAGVAMWKKVLRGKSARIVVTMGMPALVYRWFYRSHGVKALERNILSFCGMGPITESVIGSVEGKPAHRIRWLERMESLGRQAR